MSPPVPTTYISFHMLDRVTAIEGYGVSPQLSLTFGGPDATQVTLFFRDGAADYVALLVKAINSVAPAPQCELPLEVREAEGYLYKGSTR